MPSGSRSPSGAHPRDLAQDAGLIRFEDLADALIELDAVAIEWSVAAASAEDAIGARPQIAGELGRHYLNPSRLEPSSRMIWRPSSLGSAFTVTL
jgi:hypothetical protein